MPVYFPATFGIDKALEEAACAERHQPDTAKSNGDTARRDSGLLLEGPRLTHRRHGNSRARIAPRSKGPSIGEMESITLLIEQRRYVEAEAGMRHLVVCYPEEPLVWEMLGVVLHRQGKTDASIEAARQAAAVAPADLRVRFNLANLWRLSGKLAEAEASYRSLLAIQPGHTDASINLGITLKLQGRVEQAELCFCRAVDILRSSPSEDRL